MDTYNILVLEEDRRVCNALNSLFEGTFSITESSSCSDTLTQAETNSPDCILIGPSFINEKGCSLCEAVSHNPLLRHIPLIAMSDDKNNISEMLEKGLKDTVPTGADNPLFKNRILNYCEMTKAGDISSLTGTGHFDELTHLPDRAYMIKRIQEEAARFNRNGRSFAIMLCDIDDFRNINLQYGDGYGDKILVSLSEIMRQSLRKQDVLGRWSGEEFIILLPETDLVGVEAASEKLRKKIISHSFSADGEEINLSITIGVSIYDSITADVQNCISRANHALGRGKQCGKNCVVLSCLE